MVFELSGKCRRRGRECENEKKLAAVVVNVTMKYVRTHRTAY